MFIIIQLENVIWGFKTSKNSLALQQKRVIIFHYYIDDYAILISLQIDVLKLQNFITTKLWLIGGSGSNKTVEL